MMGLKKIFAIFFANLKILGAKKMHLYEQSMKKSSEINSYVTEKSNDGTLNLFAQGSSP